MMSLLYTHSAKILQVNYFVIDQHGRLAPMILYEWIIILEVSNDMVYLG